MLIRLVALFALSGCLAASAAELSGRVVGVHDGDTITVLDVGKKQHKIRLAAMDAPELKQAFGTRLSTVTDLDGVACWCGHAS